MKNFVLITLLVMIISLIGGIIVLGKTGVDFHLGGNIRVTESKANPVIGFDKIEIETVSEMVTILKTSEPDLKADLKLSRTDSDIKLTVTPDADSKILKIKVEHPRKITFFANDWAGELDVYLPESYIGDLSVKTVSGSIDSDELPLVKNMIAESTSGAIDLNFKEGERGSLTMRTVSGRIEAGKLSGFEYVKANSTSGSLDLSDLAGKVDIKTISGRIDMKFDESKGDVRADSTSGKIVIDLPATANNNFSFETVSGGLSNKNKLNLTRETRTYYEGKIGTGEGSKIDVKTVSGGLNIE